MNVLRRDVWDTWIDVIHGCGGGGGIAVVASVMVVLVGRGAVRPTVLFWVALGLGMPVPFPLLFFNWLQCPSCLSFHCH